MRTIHCLFPSANIVMVLRHPFDVCLSNFTQPFSLNLFMVNFLTLEDTASFYKSCMEIWQLSQSVLPLTVHTLRYEDVVESFEDRVNELLSFLNLSWTTPFSLFIAMQCSGLSTHPAMNKW